MKGANPTSLLLSLLVFLCSAVSAAVVSDCDQEILRAAIAEGGTVTFACDGAIGVSPELVIVTNVVLDATGRNVVLSGMGSNRLFQIQPGRTLTLVNLTLRDGSIIGTNGGSGVGGGPAIGGAVLSDRGTLKAIDCVFLNNSATGGNGGGPPISGGVPGQGGIAGGGAIHSYYGTTCLTNVTFHLNTATGGRGAGAGGMSIVGGPGGSALGGAIVTIRGSLIAHSTRFQTNRVVAGAGGQGLIGVNNAPSGFVGGGAVHSLDCELRFMAGDLTGNSCIPGQFHSPAYGGAVYHLSAQTGFFEATATTFRGNEVSSGARHDFASEAQPGSGGALWLAANRAMVSDCSFFENIAVGGAVLTGNGISGAGMGGAIFNNRGLVVARSTFRGNLARGGDVLGSEGPGSGSRIPREGRGGAIFSVRENAGGSTSAARLHVDNSTFVGNVATGGSVTTASDEAYGIGGAICSLITSLTLNHVTAVSNAAHLTYARSGTNRLFGWALLCASGSATLRNSIFSHSLSGSNVVMENSPMTDAGGNISSDATPAFTAASSRNDIDPLLGPLGDYGGLTLTMPPLPGSPAIDGAPSTSCRRSDQRGVARGYDAGCDIGAFEHWAGGALALSASRAGSLVRVAFAGQPGETYRILTSSNLATWMADKAVMMPAAGVHGYYENPGSARQFFVLEKPQP